MKPSLTHKQTQYLAALGCASLILCWLLPNASKPWGVFHQEALAIIGLVLLTPRALTAAAGRMPRTSLPTHAFCALGAIISLQWLLGSLHAHQSAVMGLMYLGAAGYAIYIGQCFAAAHGTHNPRTDGKPHAPSIAAALIVAAALCSAFMALVQWLDVTSISSWLLNGIKPGTRPRANLGQPNNLASLLLWGFVAGLYLGRRQHWTTATLLLLLAPLIVGLAATQSRTMFVALPLIVGLLFIWRRLFGQRTLIIATILAATYAGLVLAWPLVSNTLHLASGTELRPPTSSGRAEIWQTSLIAILERPWAGWGFGQITYALTAVAPVSPSTSYFEYAHNAVLDIALWFGLPATLALTTATGWWVVSRARAIRTVDAAAAMCLLASLAVHCLLEYPHAYLFFLVNAGLCVGWIEQHYLRDRAGSEANSRQTSRDCRRAMPIVAFSALFSCFCGWVAYEYLLIEADNRAMRWETSPFYTAPLIPRAPDVLILDREADFHRFARWEPTEGMTEQQLIWFERVGRSNPNSASLSRLAQAELLNNSPQRVAWHVCVHQKLNPPEETAALRNWLLSQINTARNPEAMRHAISPGKLNSCEFARTASIRRIH